MSDITERLSTAIADRYVIERELGQGGMATVYLAHDVKHDRKVALKVLRPELAAVIGADRFLQEIRVTANLQHPNILPLYDSGRAVAPPLRAAERGSGGEEFLFYVMPYVEGESLRDRINREKQLGVDDAVAIIRGVASALDYAHRRGVIHRDIKPENILLHDGNPTVADFGIALALSHAGGSRLTETGLSIGTPHYMSPEQAMGDRELDARSDIYSLGAMLYELLVGEPPFTGPTAQSIVAKVITEKPPMVSTHRETVPRHVSMTVYKALAKLPADRYPSAIAFAEALVRPQTADTDAYPLPPGETIAAPPKTWTPLTAVLMVLLVLAALLALWGWLRPVSAPAVSRFMIQLPEEQGITGRFGPTLALSPPGDQLIYVGPGPGGAPQLWRRPMDQLTATPISGTGNSFSPSVSPDGQSVAFVREGLHVVSLAGGPPLALATDSVTTLGTDWGEDGYVYFIEPGPTAIRQLARVPAAGGEREAVAAPDSAAGGNVVYAWPDALPGGAGVLLTRAGTSAEDTDVAVVNLASGEVRPILRGIYGRYVPTGHIVYTRGDGALLVAPFDEHGLEVTGPSVPLLEGIVTKDVGASEFTVARNGTLVYVAGEQADESLVWVDRDGTERVVAEELMGQFGAVSLNPDGQRIAVETTVDGNTDIWIYDLAQATLSRLTFDDAVDSRPVWEPDGHTVTFVSWRSTPRGLWRKRADGSAPAESLLITERPVQEGDWSRDGRWLAVREGPGGSTGRDIYYLEVGVDSAPRPLVVTEFNELDPGISPDGRWLVYQSNESGRGEIYIRSFPAGGGRWQVSTDGGIEPRWAHSGREVFYRQADGRFVAAEIRVSGGSIVVGARRPLFAADVYDSDATHHMYDVTADDRRFLFVRQSGGSRGLVVVLNWFEELKRRTAP